MADGNGFLVAIGECLRRRRRALGKGKRKVTQAALAQRVGWQHQAICRLERGQTAISLERFVLVCHALGTHPAAVILDAERMEANRNDQD